ncbi:nucleoside hydrolase [Bauldia sp.]|uniref:nucleoside hydrolase n=1 Tax=Bauldia sp. TaxID=2575872 RepID=UPI003BAB8CD3
MTPKTTALLLATAFGLTGTTVAADDPPVPIIISTDTATGLIGGWVPGASDVDDGLAIAMAIDSPRLDVRGIVVTWGNTFVDPSYTVAKRIVDGMGTSVPVVHGAPRALPRDPMSNYEGTAITTACLNDGVRFMAGALEAASEPVTIIAIGPLTDLACLAVNYPDAIGNIERAVVTGGRDPHQRLEIAGIRIGDFNMAIDIPAVKYLLNETTIPIRFMSYGLTSSFLVPSSDRNVLCQSTLPIATDFLCPALVPWIDQWRDTFGEDGFHPWDQNAVFVTAEPDAFICEPAQYTIVDCSKGDCAGHEAPLPFLVALETDQVWLTPDGDSDRIEMCRSYAPGDGKARFSEAIYAFARDKPQ